MTGVTCGEDALGEGAGEDKTADLLNDGIIKLSRILVPIASTVVGSYGQDRYGHAWQTQMIPSLAPYTAFAQYARDSKEFQLLWVAMIRARNRVVDTLEQASYVARVVLSESS